MRFPSWNEFLGKVTDFEKDINQNIIQFQNNHPLLDRAVSSSFSLLPPPFNAIAEQIYGSSAGDPEAKITKVLESLDEIQKQGDSRYKETTLRLENILSQFTGLKDIVAQQGTLIKIQEALVSSDSIVNQKLNELTDTVNLVSGNVNKLVNAVGTGFRIGDRFLSDIHGTFGTIADQQGNIIKLGSEEIRPEDLERLSPGDQKLLLGYQEAMLTNYYVYAEVYPKLDREVNPITKATLKLDLKDKVGKMCSDFDNIILFLIKLGYHLDDHYLGVRFLCEQAGKQLSDQVSEK